MTKEPHASARRVFWIVEVAEPFDWRFTRDDLTALMERLAPHEPQFRLVA